MAHIAWADTAHFSSSPQFNVPKIGSGIGLIDRQNEKMIGEKVYREVQHQLPVAHNTWLEDQLLSVF